MIMETEKSFNLPSASWRLRKTSGVVQRSESQGASVVDVNPCLEA